MNTISLKKGLDLRLAGGVDPRDAAPSTIIPAEVAIVPDDYPGLSPRPVVKPGDTVASGQALIVDKNTPDICLASPAAGVVKEVIRGERRKLERIVVTVSEESSASITDKVTGDVSTSDLRKALANAGLWAMMRQRPYDIVPALDCEIRDIFVTTFDSAPLAPELLKGKITDSETLQAGINTLARLTSGKVYLGVATENQLPALSGAIITKFKGPHPAGNVGTQIAAIAPVNKGETVVTLDIVTLYRIGKYMLTGAVDFTTTVAVTGSEVAKPHYTETLIGCDIASLIKGALVEPTTHHRRIISGNVLTGVRVSAEGYLRYPYRQITVIPEGDDVDEFMGWASNSPDKMSESRSFLSYFLRGRKFSPDARLHGGRRAMILSGQYESLMPMDILPEYLLKAIIARDIDRMEALGIYEVAPEDFALAEYADASKLELQKTVREGLDYLRKELC